MNRALMAVAMLAGLAGPVVAQNEPVPDGLSCPVEIAGGERIAVGEVTLNPDVTGYCIYYLVGETDFEAVTMTLRTAPAGFDWRAAYQAPKIERGGMELVEEGTRAMPFGGGQQVAEVATIMRVSKMTVYRMVHSGVLPAIRVGRSYRVPERAVHDYLREAFVEAG